MSNPRKKLLLLRAVVCLQVMSLVLPPSGRAGDWPVLRNRRKATKVETLAKKLDKVQKHVDSYGSIVAKSPDVWGESRLMRNRSEVEQQLKARLQSFQFRVNARQSTRDAALLAQAVALQEQISEGQVRIGTPPATQPAGTALPTSGVSGLIAGFDAASTGQGSALIPRSNFSQLTGATGSFGGEVGIEPTIELDQLNRYLNHLNELRRLNEGDDTADSPGYALNLIRIPVSVLPGSKTRTGYGAEVEITVEPHFGDELLPIAFRDLVINGVRNRITYDAFAFAQQADMEAVRTLISDYYSGRMYNEFANVVRAAEQVGLPGNADAAELAFDSFVRSSEAIRTGRNPKPRKTQAAALDKAVKAILQYRDAQLAQPDQIESQRETTLDALEELTNPPNLVSAPSFALLSGTNFSSLSPSFSDSVNGHTLIILADYLHSRLVVPPSDPAKKIEEQNLYLNGLTYPAAEELLSEEIRAAYEFLSRDSSTYLWDEFCTPQLATWIRENRREVPEEQSDYLNRQYDRTVADPVGTRSPVDWNPKEGIQSRRIAFFREMRRSFPQARGSVVESLAWHILVEAALLEDRLVRDMKEVASTRNCPCLPTHPFRFAGPNPPPESRSAFAAYVKCRWPIHVFTLDPVTQDQNVSDTFQQRRELQVALAVAASNRIIGAQSLTRYARRLEYDLETISLNRTAIGFAHGQNTFGWRFYPRVQTPPVPGHLGAVKEYFAGAPNADARLRTSKLEAGMRECTALVVMPSFLPQLTVDVRTNWFPLGGRKHFAKLPQKRSPGFEDSVELSRDIVQLRQLAHVCKQDAHLYRDGEVYRLCKAVERLDRRMPLQTYSAQVPWENDLGGFEMFNPGAGALRPQLLGWYGAPGVLVTDVKSRRDALGQVQYYMQQLEIARLNRSIFESALPDESSRTDAEKARLKSLTDAVSAQSAKLELAEQTAARLIAASTSTRVFLVGKNFSVLDTQVIAGGVDVSNSVRLLSRRLMSIEIPSTVSTVKLERYERQMVSVNLMTPYGVASNRLMVPVHDGSNVGPSPEELAAAIKTAAEAAASKAASAAASTAATKAVSDAIGKRYPLAYKLNSPTAPLVGEILYDDGDKHEFRICEVKGLKVSVDLSTDEARDVNGMLNRTSQWGEVAFRMTAYSTSEKVDELEGINVGPMRFRTEEGLELDVLAEKIAAALRCVPEKFDAKKLKLQPYVRFSRGPLDQSAPNVADRADRPIFKVDGILEFRVFPKSAHASAPPATKQSDGLLEVPPRPNGRQ